MSLLHPTETIPPTSPSPFSRAASAWSSLYGDRHRLTRIKEFPPSITPPKRVRINSRRDHFILQWWDPAAKRNLCDRVNGDLVEAISRAREIESRLENSRSSGLGRQKLRHRELVEAFVGDLRRRTDAGEIDARTMMRYQSALEHYLAYTTQTSVETAFPFATTVNRNFAMSFSAFLAERCVSPNGHSNTDVRRMSALLGSGDDSEESRRRHLAIDAAEQHGGRLTVRALMRSRAGFKSADDAEQTLNALVAAGLGRWEQSQSGKSGGRPTAVFVLVESASDPVNDSDTTPSPNDTTSTNSASGEVSSVSMSDDAAA